MNYKFFLQFLLYTCVATVVAIACLIQPMLVFFSGKPGGRWVPSKVCQQLAAAGGKCVACFPQQLSSPCSPTQPSCSQGFHQLLQSHSSSTSATSAPQWLVFTPTHQKGALADRQPCLCLLAGLLPCLRLLRACSTAVCFITVVINSAFAVSLTGFLVMHANMLAANCTTIEMYEKERIHPWPYNKGMRRNLEDVFGKRWAA